MIRFPTNEKQGYKTSSSAEMFYDLEVQENKSERVHVD